MRSVVWALSLQLSLTSIAPPICTSLPGSQVPAGVTQYRAGVEEDLRIRNQPIRNQAGGKRRLLRSQPANPAPPPPPRMHRR